MAEEGDEVEESDRADAGDDTAEAAAAAVGAVVGGGWRGVGKASVRAEVGPGDVTAGSAGSERGWGGEDAEVNVGAAAEAPATAAFGDGVTVFSAFRRSRHTQRVGRGGGIRV